MTESAQASIEYAAGYQKNNINKADIDRAILDLQDMDEEHGAFWVTANRGHDQATLEVHQDMSLSFSMSQNVEDEVVATAKSWKQTAELYKMLVDGDFETVVKFFNSGL